MDARQQPVECASGHRGVRHTGAGQRWPRRSGGSLVAAKVASTLAVITAIAAVGNAIRPDIAFAAGYRTQYFLVTASTPEYAKEVAEAAERLRKELAIEWLGRELPPWRDSCPIEVLNDSGAGGVTQFYFDRGQPYGWSMRIQGTRERVLDSVLPHEVTHMVFATHFGRPLPRWADEGACTTTEHISERQKQERLLNTFLQTNRGIPFNAMFAMTEYPSDVLPLYAQGYSLSRFLIALEGRRSFIQFVGEGLADRRWAAAVKRNYGFADLSDLQQQWNRWVAQGGHPELATRFRSSSAATTQVASVNANARGRSRNSPLAATAATNSANPSVQPSAASFVIPPATMISAGQTASRQSPANQLAASQLAANQLASNQMASNQMAASQIVGDRIASVAPTAPLVPVTYADDDLPTSRDAEPSSAAESPTAALAAEPRVNRGESNVKVAFTPLAPLSATAAASRTVADDPYAKTRIEYLREHPEEAARDPRRSKPVRQVPGSAEPKLILEWSKQPSATVFR